MLALVPYVEAGVGFVLLVIFGIVILSTFFSPPRKRHDGSFDEITIACKEDTARIRRLFSWPNSRDVRNAFPTFSIDTALYLIKALAEVNRYHSSARLPMFTRVYELSKYCFISYRSELCVLLLIDHADGNLTCGNSDQIVTHIREHEQPGKILVGAYGRSAGSSALRIAATIVGQLPETSVCVYSFGAARSAMPPQMPANTVHYRVSNAADCIPTQERLHLSAPSAPLPGVPVLIHTEQGTLLQNHMLSSYAEGLVEWKSYYGEEDEEVVGIS